MPLDNTVPYSNQRSANRPARPRTAQEQLEDISYGAGKGFENNLMGTAQMVTQPVTTGKEMYAGLKAVAQDPSLAVNALYGMWNKATSGPEGAAEVLAENINPRNLVKNLASPKKLGILIGENAATWRKDAALEAQRLAAAGASPDKIWLKTGTWLGPDGRWRQEISDANLKVHLDVGRRIAQATDPTDWQAPLRQVISHPELEAAYPSLLTGSTFTADPLTPSWGYVEDLSNGGTNLGIGKTIIDNPTQVKSTTVHELQHMVQDAEKFQPGGSPETVLSKVDPRQIQQVIDNYRARIADPKTPRAMANDLTDRITHLQQSPSNWGAYAHLAGEAEARGAQLRALQFGITNRLRSPAATFGGWYPVDVKNALLY